MIEGTVILLCPNLHSRSEFGGQNLCQVMSDLPSLTIKSQKWEAEKVDVCGHTEREWGQRDPARPWTPSLGS